MANMSDTHWLNRATEVPDPAPTDSPGAAPSSQGTGNWQSRATSTGGWMDRAAEDVAPKTTASQSALEHFGNQGTLGYLPELQAKAGQAVKKISSYFGGSPEATDEDLRAKGFTINQPEDTYESNLKENTARQALEAKEHPYASAAGGVAGALATAPIAGGALGKIGIGAAGEGAGLLKTLGQGAAGGAVIGAAQNPGETHGTFDDLRTRGENAVTGGLIGGAGAGVIKGVASGLKNLEPALQDIAETKAFKATGAMLKDFRSALQKDKLSQLGRTALDNGLVQAGDTIESTATKTAALQQDTGKQIGDIYKNVMSKVNSPEFLSELTDAEKNSLNQSKIQPEQLANEMKDQFKNSLKGKVDGTQAYRKLSRTLDEISQNGETVDLDQANAIKRDLDNKINYARSTQDLPTYQKALFDVRTRLKDQINAHVGTLDKIVGSQDSQKLVKLNDLYSKLSTLNEIGVDRLARENANRAISLTDTIAGVGGAVYGAERGYKQKGIEGALEGAALGSLLGVANKVGRTYGPGIQAATANRTAQLAGAIRQIPGAGLVGAGLNATQNAPATALGAASQGLVNELRGPPSRYKNGPPPR